MTKLKGTAYVRYDGKLLRTGRDSKFDPGGPTHETVVGNDVDYKEGLAPSSLEAKIKYDADLDLIAMRKAEIVVDFEADTGQAYSSPKMWTTEGPTDDGDGWASLKAEGQPAVKRK